MTRQPNISGLKWVNIHYKVKFSKCFQLLAASFKSTKQACHWSTTLCTQWGVVKQKQSEQHCSVVSTVQVLSGYLPCFDPSCLKLMHAHSSLMQHAGQLSSREPSNPLGMSSSSIIKRPLAVRLAGCKKDSRPLSSVPSRLTPPAASNRHSVGCKPTCISRPSREKHSSCLDASPCCCSSDAVKHIVAMLVSHAIAWDLHITALQCTGSTAEQDNTSQQSAAVVSLAFTCLIAAQVIFHVFILIKQTKARGSRAALSVHVLSIL